MGTERIEAIGENGRKVWVLKTTSQIPVRTLSGPPSTLTGLASYKLATGEAVNVDGDAFVVVGTGERLQRA